MSDGDVPWVKFGNKTDEGFFAAIGRLTLSWGHLDLALEAMTHLLYVLFNGKAIEKKEPKALGHRLKFLRAFFGKLPLTAEQQKAFVGVIDQIDAEAEKRHDIIHGAVVEHVEGTGEAALLRIPRKGEDIRRHTANTRNVLAAAVKANELADFLFTFVEELQSALQSQGLLRGEQKEP